MASVNTRNFKNTEIIQPRAKMLKLPEIPQISSHKAPFELSDNPFTIPTSKFGSEAEKQQTPKKGIYHDDKKFQGFKALLSQDEDDVQFLKDAKKIPRFFNGSKEKAGNVGNPHKENLHDFIAKKREMFLVQYALGVKRQEMEKLEEIAQAEEQKLLDDEKALEEDAAKFDAFLKENDKTSVEAIKRAEAETKAKVEKTQEIKKLNLSITAVRSEMSKHEDYLKELLEYRLFLSRLTPKDKKPKPKLEENKLEEDNEEEKDPLEYFKTPDQLLDIFTVLEENNLALIQACQESEETSEDLKAKIAATDTKMDAETQILKNQIDLLTTNIIKEEDKQKNLDYRPKEYPTSDTHEKILDDLKLKIKDVYKRCMGESDGNLSTLQMLTNIEIKLESLFETIELLPAQKLEQAERAKDKERRKRLREGKMEAQRQLQEERIQRALERARAPVKKKVGKPVVFRSAPPQKKYKEKVGGAKKKEEEDLEYYGLTAYE